MLRKWLYLLAAQGSMLFALPVVADDSFEKSVRPILTEHCVKCHGPDRQRGGLRLDTRDFLVRGGDTGTGAVPGKPDESLLLKAVRHQDGLDMPPKGKVPEAQVAVLAAWVKAGAVGPKSAVAVEAKYKPGTIGVEEKAYWAFQAPKRAEVPSGANAIDHFIAAKLAAEGLKAAPPAEKLAILRRVTFDLIGLPPTPAELDAFCADQSPDAYEKLIERLLARPEYGERWATMWLDLVRYADSDGYREDKFRPHAWPYRDAVVRAFNSDKPFDRFATEQVAGDEAFPNDPDAVRATGYLRLWQYEWNQRDVRGQWSNIINDITDVTADAFLALGMGCARCHDHKFDPILQKDYYRLQAFFAGIDFPTEPVFDTAEKKSEYETRNREWEAATAAVRAKIDDLLRPIREKEMKAAARKFPEDVEAIFNKPEAERTPHERQIFALAFRQVTVEFERADTRLSKEKKVEYEALSKELTRLETTKPVKPLAMIARDLGPTAAETMLPVKPAVAVDPGFPTVLGDLLPTIAPTATSTGRRSALAQWIVRPENPLTARVYVNRIWQQHFGRGLVATPSDFGRLGEAPSHPELLDWLATEFVRTGWSVKKLHALILQSATYRQAAVGAAAAAKDPENRFLAKMPVRRLDAEQVRDAMLAVSGELKPVHEGPPQESSQPVRGIFTAHKRNTRDPLMEALDAADGLNSCARRNRTITATQSLLLLNGPEVAARSAAFAKRLLAAHPDDADLRVKLAYRLAYGRAPKAEELAGAKEFLNAQARQAMGKSASLKTPVTAPARLAAYTDFCHALLNSSEFLYVD